MIPSIMKKSPCVLKSGWGESSLEAAVAFICGTARSTGLSDASGQMHLRIDRVICTCHISSFVYVTHNTTAYDRSCHMAKQLC